MSAIILLFHSLSKAVAIFNKMKYLTVKCQDFPWLGHGHLSSSWLNHPSYLHEGVTCVLCRGLNQKVTPVHLLRFFTPLQAALAVEVSSRPGNAACVGLPQLGLRGESEGQSRGRGSARPQRHKALGSQLRLCGVAPEPHGVGQAEGAANQAEGCPPG